MCSPPKIHSSSACATTMSLLGRRATPRSRRTPGLRPSGAFSSAMYTLPTAAAANPNTITITSAATQLAHV